jgi:ATP-dependent protease HslVU peptidase subunit
MTSQHGEGPRATTVVAVRRDGRVAIGGDGQVTLGDTVMKRSAKKVRLLKDGRYIAGFAGAVADAFALFEKLEQKLERHPANLTRACPLCRIMRHLCILSLSHCDRQFLSPAQ